MHLHMHSDVVVVMCLSLDLTVTMESNCEITHGDAFHDCLSTNAKGILNTYNTVASTVAARCYTVVWSDGLSLCRIAASRLAALRSNIRLLPIHPIMAFSHLPINPTRYTSLITSSQSNVHFMPFNHINAINQ